MSEGTRPPAVAGQFYEGEGARLARQIEACFLDPRGPGELPPRHRSANRTIRAAIVPHAGYQYSGAIAARAFFELGKQRPAPVVLVLGVDHHGLGAPFALSDRPWETPLGRVDVDHALVRSLRQPPIVVDERAHESEHSIEVELPFLQYVEPYPVVVPLTVRFASFPDLQRVAEVVRRGIEGRDLLLMASTDFSHYVSPETARRLDRRAIDRILQGDARGLYDTVTEARISMCGIAPTTVLLEILRSEGLRARLLAWGHSGEVEPMSQVVGYASILLEAPGAPSPEPVPDPSRSAPPAPGPAPSVWEPG
ncbi:MAG: AmmeMemoRadiSam system protein B [Thermoplasmata archaeon]|nr:AmmeMemoRadiSam system protein B [Thermoplasmata archaeon]MCI4359349.1 AmmeMemoRadiSam system protein B [Thermoplasmata archaeon]